ncbi:helix-turn-helix domain-containing protein [Defluviimonas sp. WL0050]|uniref:Helix-turn-helix domain-containing protein n=1 Tax=Albidovulum litorale TaxID=2984134 RepID=A0ABT2ZTW8_9RHOB|nr:helix-turn-helix domain-containing protein [Defluviimonas sp. WL0050]MCV2874610.1 helix-turn-helix domain-containing protein [Defluviimonas sp. WL0050]
MEEQMNIGHMDLRKPLRERDLAERWQKSLRTLQRWRAEGYAPPHIQIGGSIYYRPGDIIAFENRMRHGGDDT